MDQHTLPPDQQRILAEIVTRSRRMYRAALKMQTDQTLATDALADLYVNSRLTASYADVLWTQSGETYREEQRQQALTTTPALDPDLDPDPGE